MQSNLDILCPSKRTTVPVSIIRKSISGRHRPVRVADGPMMADVDLCRMLAGVSTDSVSGQQKAHISLLIRSCIVRKLHKGPFRVFALYGIELVLLCVGFNNYLSVRNNWLMYGLVDFGFLWDTNLYTTIHLQKVQNWLLMASPLMCNMNKCIHPNYWQQTVQTQKKIGVWSSSTMLAIHLAGSATQKVLGQIW